MQATRREMHRMRVLNAGRDTRVHEHHMKAARALCAVLAERQMDGAGSRGYICAILKGVVAQCDARRLEVAEDLLGMLLRLRSEEAARRARVAARRRPRRGG